MKTNMKLAIEGEDSIVKGERAVILLEMNEAKDLYTQLNTWFGQDKHILVEKKTPTSEPETAPIKPGPVDQKSLDRIMREYDEEVKRKGLGLEKTGGWIPPKIVPFGGPLPYYFQRPAPTAAQPGIPDPYWTVTSSFTPDATFPTFPLKAN